jgi:opacity protein-like surface antigen
MKRTCLVLALATILASWASAQVSLGWGFHGHYARLDVASSQISSVYGNGWGGGAHLDVNMLMISLRFSGDYVTFSPDQEKYRNALATFLGNAAAGYSIDGGNVNILSVSANAKWALLPLPVLSPYLTGGIGLVQRSAGDLTVKNNGVPVSGIPSIGEETGTAVNLGAGIDLKLGGLALFAEARYTWILGQGKSTKYIPLSVGITF